MGIVASLKMTRRRWLLLMLVTAAFAAAAIVWLGRVSLTPSATDRRIAMQIFGDQAVATNFDAQIAQIRLAQRHFLRAAPIDRGIAHGMAREAADIEKLGYGLCYDRSRAIEMILSAKGYQTRHASLYPVQGISSLDELTTKGVPSHAVTEVLTTRGWLMVGSNSDWIALTKGGRPVSAGGIHAVPSDDWAEPIPDNGIFDKPLVVIYGLYSRHGGFYAPYVPVPDFNIGHLLEYSGDSQVLIGGKS